MNWFSTIGLLLDIAGVLLLFKYGLPSRIKVSQFVADEEEEKDKSFNKMVRRRANTGLTLILIGFLFQLLGSNSCMADCVYDCF